MQIIETLLTYPFPFMLIFDDTGYLVPHGIIPASLADIKQQLVFNKRRETLYESLLDFIADIQALGVLKFFIWVNGSFTTLKKYPKDIDIVVFVDNRYYGIIEKKAKKLTHKYSKTLDVFFEPEYLFDHPLYEQTLSDKQYWQDLFCFDRKGFGKGIIELIF